MAEAKFVKKEVPNPDNNEKGEIELVAKLTDEDIAIIWACDAPAAEKPEQEKLFNDVFGKCLTKNSEKAHAIGRAFERLEAKQNSADMGGETEVVPRPAGGETEVVPQP